MATHARKKTQERSRFETCSSGTHFGTTRNETKRMIAMQPVEGFENEIHHWIAPVEGEAQKRERKERKNGEQ
jgi:hypothetical protein